MTDPIQHELCTRCGSWEHATKDCPDKPKEPCVYCDEDHDLANCPIQGLLSDTPQGYRADVAAIEDWGQPSTSTVAQEPRSASWIKRQTALIDTYHGVTKAASKNLMSFADAAKEKTTTLADDTNDLLDEPKPATGIMAFILPTITTIVTGGGLIPWVKNFAEQRKKIHYVSTNIKDQNEKVTQFGQLTIVAEKQIEEAAKAIATLEKDKKDAEDATATQKKEVDRLTKELATARATGNVTATTDLDAQLLTAQNDLDLAQTQLRIANRKATAARQRIEKAFVVPSRTEARSLLRTAVTLLPAPTLQGKTFGEDEISLGEFPDLFPEHTRGPPKDDTTDKPDIGTWMSGGNPGKTDPPANDYNDLLDVPLNPKAPGDDANSLAEAIPGTTRPTAVKPGSIPPAEPGEPAFPAPQAISGDKFLEPKKPHEFDGVNAHFRSWTLEVRQYFESNDRRFRNPGHVFNELTSLTKPQTRARMFLDSLAISIADTESNDGKEWQLLRASGTTVGQVLRWLLGKMRPHFHDQLAVERALRKIAELSQGTGYFSTFMLAVEKARQELGWSHREALPYLIRGTNRELLVAIATRCSKTTTELHWTDFVHWGTPVDYEIRSIGRIKSDRAPRQTRALPAPAKPNQPNRDAPQQRKCGRISSYDQDRVPMNVRGPLYWVQDASDNDARRLRNSHCIAHGLCERCRAPRNLHTGNSRFVPVRPFTEGLRQQPRALPAPARDSTQPLVEDVTSAPAYNALPAPTNLLD